MRPLLDLLDSSYQPREAVLFLGPGAICISRTYVIACADGNRIMANLPPLRLLNYFSIMFMHF